MKNALFILLLIFSFIPLITAEEITLIDGSTIVYSQILTTDKDGVSFETKHGVYNVNWKNIPESAALKIDKENYRKAMKKDEKKQAKTKSKKTSIAEAWYKKAATYRKVNLNTALQCSLKALKADPNYLKALWLTGVIYLDLNTPDKAIGYFLKAQKVMDRQGGMTETFDYAKTLYYIGLAYTGMTKNNKAFDYFYGAKDILDTLGKEDSALYAKTMDYIAIIEGKEQLEPRLYYKEHLKHRKERKKKSGTLKTGY